MTLEIKLLRAFESALLDIADEYQRNSPVGATGLLKSSWDVNVTTTPTSISGIISNTAPASKFRGLGRDAGRFPPLEPLKDWVLAKGLASEPKKAKRIAFLIGRKIAREGTNRFKTNNNPFSLNRDGSKKVELNRLFINRLKFYLGD
jgi:hypothetical protein